MAERKIWIYSHRRRNADKEVGLSRPLKHHFELRRLWSLLESLIPLSIWFLRGGLHDLSFRENPLQLGVTPDGALSTSQESTFAKHKSDSPSGVPFLFLLFKSYAAMPPFHSSWPFFPRFYTPGEPFVWSPVSSTRTVLRVDWHVLPCFLLQESLCTSALSSSASRDSFL